MMPRQTIQTDLAPRALGRYSQAIRIDNQVYISGQLPLDPETLLLVEGNTKQRIHQVFKNIEQICLAANGSLQDIVKLTIYLTDLQHASLVNEIMDSYFQPPYPARAMIGVSALPKDSFIEVEGMMILHTT